MGNFQYSYQVCSCNNVTLGEIINAIENKNANTIEKIGLITDAGTNCGCCKSPENDFSTPKRELYLTQILNKVLGKN
jgi:bacterioferritin-associated ferredoxin